MILLSDIIAFSYILRSLSRQMNQDYSHAGPELILVSWLGCNNV